MARNTKRLKPTGDDGAKIRAPEAAAHLHVKQ